MASERAYSIVSGGEIHFLTFTVVDWLDVFSRPEFAQIILNSLAFCIAKKGLQLHAWVLMTNHLHIIASPASSVHLSDIIRDFKKFTSSRVLEILVNNLVNESRRRTFLHAFEYNGTNNSRNEKFQFWQQNNHAIHIYSKEFIEQKLAYLHNNPVRQGFVDEPWQYRYSSARDYMTNQKGLLPLILL